MEQLVKCIVLEGAYAQTLVGRALARHVGLKPDLQTRSAHWYKFQIACNTTLGHFASSIQIFGGIGVRLTDEQIRVIRQLARQVAGSRSRVLVFGSRLDDTAHGGDVDLLLELAEPVENPALMAAQLSARVSRAMQGRKVDVLLSAPNLMRLPIHDIAFKEGKVL